MGVRIFHSIQPLQRSFALVRGAFGSYHQLLLLGSLIWCVFVSMMWLFPVAMWCTLAILSIPHWLYCFIWFNPKTFMRINAACTKNHPVDTFASMAAFIKLIQYLTVAWWYIRVAPVVGMADFTTLRLLAAGLLLAGVARGHSK